MECHEAVDWEEGGGISGAIRGERGGRKGVGLGLTRSGKERRRGVIVGVYFRSVSRRLRRRERNGEGVYQRGGRGEETVFCSLF